MKSNEVVLYVDKIIEFELRNIWNGNYPDDVWPEKLQQELYDLLNSADYVEKNDKSLEAIYYWSEIEWDENKNKGVEVINRVLEDYGEEFYKLIVIYDNKSYVTEGYFEGKSFDVNLKFTVTISGK